MKTKKGYPKRRDEIEQIMEGKERKRKKERESKEKANLEIKSEALTL